VNKRLAQTAERIKGLQQQLRREEQQAAELQAQVQKHLDTAERDAARRVVLHLRQAEEARQHTQARLNEAETTYQEVLRLREASLRQLEEDLGRARQWLERMDWARLRAELAQLAARSLGQVQTAGKRLAGMEGTMISLVASAEAEAEVALGRMSSSVPALRAEDDEALADALLEEFEAKGRLTGEAEEEAAFLTLGDRREGGIG
jgi:hypothetical protein